MPGQNIEKYFTNKYDLRLDGSGYFDLTLAGDESDYDQESVFSDSLIGEFDGNRLPINIDLNSALCNQKTDLTWSGDQRNNILISSNYYNPDNDDLNCYTAQTLCDIGLTAIDNGLTSEMTGETLTFTMGINDFEKFNPLFYDRRFKMHSVNTYAEFPNERLNGNDLTVYNIVSKENDTVGYYNELYGGFYQGFYKLYGYDYEVFPERVNKGWTSEMLLKPRQRDEYTLQGTEKYLNDIYPENSGTFFFFGTRAENKFYHPTDGKVTPLPNNPNPSGLTGYTRVTEPLSGCVKTCACYNTGVTNSDCIEVYPTTGTTQRHNISTCNTYTSEVPNPPVDPAMDIYSNALSIRFSGDPKNPHLCVKYIKMTGDCITTGTCQNTGVVYSSGYTINEICSSRGIYDDCNYDNLVCFTANTEERWVMISAVFERYQYLEDCDLLNWGGLNDIRQFLYPSSINGASYNIIQPPQTHPTGTKEKKQNITKIDRKWLREEDKRLGALKIYVNGYLFMVLEDFEEIIPRELNTQKEKQLGVPFNISFGGGTQGLRESLIFKDCQSFNGPYIQDPELMTNETLAKSTYSGLTTNIKLESNFGGTFMGGISQFRMYAEPLSSPQVQHNFRMLRYKFDLYDFWCPNCYDCLTDCYFDFNVGQAGANFASIAADISNTYNLEITD